MNENDMKSLINVVLYELGHSTRTIHAIQALARRGFGASVHILNCEKGDHCHGEHDKFVTHNVKFN